MPPLRRARAWSPWALSLVAHLALGLVALATRAPETLPPPAPPPPIEWRFVEAPSSQQPAAATTPAPATRHETAPPAPSGRRPGSLPPTPGPAPQPGPSEPVAGPSPEPQVVGEPGTPGEGPRAPAPLRATELLAGASNLATRGAAEGWLAPSPGTGRAPRDTWGANRCTTDECVAAIARAPTEGLLAGTARDHRPAGATENDRHASRRVLEGLDLVREVPNLGSSVRSAPMVTVAGQRREMRVTESGVAEEFDQRHGSSFAGMTLGARTSDLRYHLLAVELEVEQSPSGQIERLEISRASGQPRLDRAAERALREALDELPLRTDRRRWSRWRLEVSDAVTGPSLLNGNEGWTVFADRSDGVALRARMRVIAQRLLGAVDAGA
ncbi:MAG: TonB C-terminal domain-containing protein [Myxococcales bacterium]|nr:TonB C-terminal domain-containing protein [Myxococcales bacterium]